MGRVTVEGVGWWGWAPASGPAHPPLCVRTSYNGEGLSVARLCRTEQSRWFGFLNVHQLDRQPARRGPSGVQMHRWLVVVADQVAVAGQDIHPRPEVDAAGRVPPWRSVQAPAPERILTHSAATSAVEQIAQNSHAVRITAGRTSAASATAPSTTNPVRARSSDAHGDIGAGGWAGFKDAAKEEGATSGSCRTSPSRSVSSRSAGQAAMWARERSRTSCCGAVGLPTPAVSPKRSGYGSKVCGDQTSRDVGLVLLI